MADQGGRKPSKQARVDAMNPAAAAIKKGLTKVINRSAAAVQVTAEQLISKSFDANSRKVGTENPDLMIVTKAELSAHFTSKREDFEKTIRKDPTHLNAWLKYTKWEVHVAKSNPRARAVFERASDHHSSSEVFWRAFAVFEMSDGQSANARSVLQRATSTLPGSADLWLLAILLERSLSQVAAARDLYNTWMNYQPHAAAWRCFARFELDQTDAPDRKERTRSVLSRFAALFNEEPTWTFYAACERELGDSTRAVEVLTTAMRALPDPYTSCPRLVIALADAYVGAEDAERAREVYVTAVQQVAALDMVLTADHKALQKHYEEFELVHGGDEELARAVIVTRRTAYRDETARNPDNLSAFTSLIEIEKAAQASPTVIADLYQQACFGSVPAADTKNPWREHVALWLASAHYHEHALQDVPGAEAVIKRGLACIHGKPFGFTELWIALAELHQRHSGPEQARSIIDTAIGLWPARKLFRHAIETDTALGDVERVRALYDKYTAAFGEAAAAWLEHVRFEQALGAHDQVGAVIEKALASPKLKERDALWVAGITARVSRGDIDGARVWYAKLLAAARSTCLTTVKDGASSQPMIDSAVLRLRKVHGLYSKFELSLSREDSVTNLRREWKDTVVKLRKANVAASAPLASDWRDFEGRHGTPETQRAMRDVVDARERKRRDLMKEAAAFE